jgi:hypothetical protein
MTHSIVAGKVIVGRTTKPADYESKKAEVELSFAIAEGSTDEQAAAALTAVSQVAIDKVHELLGLTTPGGAAPATGKSKAKATEVPAAKVKVESAGPVEAAAKVAAAAASLEPEPGEQESSTHLPAGLLDDGLGDLLGAAPQPVTDEELTGAITRKNAEIKNPQAIRGLIGKYVAPPKQARDIPADVRHKFLEELGGLKAA